MAKKFGFALKAGFIIEDGINKHKNLASFEINHTGPSYLEENNKKLTPVIEKNWHQ